MVHRNTHVREDNLTSSSKNKMWKSVTELEITRTWRNSRSQTAKLAEVSRTHRQRNKDGEKAAIYLEDFIYFYLSTCGFCATSGSAQGLFLPPHSGNSPG